MQLLSSIKIAYKALTTHKLRSFLTILGIVIGITSVILVFSAGEAMKGLVLTQIESWGSDTIEVEVKMPNTSQASMENATNFMMGVSITTLKESDAQAVKDHPNISDAYSAIIGQSMVTYADESKMMQLWGVSASFIDMDSSEVGEGRFFTNDEDKSLAKVAVIGSGVKEKFFGDQEVVGKFIKIGKNNFKVIGVIKERGEIMYMNMDDFIYIPLKPLQKLVMGVDHVMFILAKLKDMDLAEATAEDLTLMMRDRHNITDPNKDDFAVITMAEAMEIWGSIMGGITLLLMAIVAVSLIVGGVGIMNIMFVSVTERTSEIGLRKALGASQSKILSQFLWEAVALTFIGGVIGIIFGLLISFLTSLGAKSQGFDWAFVINPLSLVIAVGASVVIGLIFGLLPARRAAKMDPIEALQYEY
ncbi:ABC transporter permease [Patescibacteria group bacterium]|nr:ABC transporter permease [Patescibacteria group bacterium]